MKRRYFRKQHIIFSFFGLAVIATSTIVTVSCSQEIPVITEKAVNIIPKDTPYKQIHDLEFGIQFDNSGGYNPSRNNNDSMYAVYGTGWLFDWNKDSIDTSGTPGQWTGYFATNLHVIDALLNPKDNNEYIPSWLQGPNLAGRDRTLHFSIGKYDNNQASPFFSTTSDITYVPIGMDAPATGVKENTLPKTQYAATSFTGETVISLDSVGKPVDTNLNPYVDFAVLAVTIDYRAHLINPMLPSWQQDRQRAKDDAFENWIIPAMNVLKQYAISNNSAPSYTQIFDNTNYVSTAANNQFSNVYIGGYPFTSGREPASYASKRMISSTQYLSPNSTGSQVWTINTDKTASRYFGQPVSVDKTIAVDGRPLRNGAIYSANSFRGFKQSYHGVEYKQYGLGYVITNSNLSAGSSGSIGMSQDKTVLGIYFGTIENSNGESPVGLLQKLIFTDDEYNSDLNYFRLYKLRPYDLFTGGAFTSKSYASSFAVSKIKTYLFS